jgi:DNA-binding CsgD family transcriptional regulator
VLAGRGKEQARVAALLAGAAAGHGGALVLRGLPGVGKSTLLAASVTRAEQGAAGVDGPADEAGSGGLRVLRTAGIESESPLAFAALQRLLRPAMPHVDALPAPQARALRAAFGEADSDADSDRFLVFLATLSLLAEAAEEQPVLAVVDDAHWLDDASAAALQFAARRLDTERVAVLFAARDGDVRVFDSSGLPELVLDGIDPAGAADLLRGAAGAEVPPAVTERLVRETGGNPLALVEVADALTSAQLRGEQPLPQQLPLTEGVERAFLDRYRRLPEAAQTWLLVAAADDAGQTRIIGAAAAALGADDQAQHQVERSGLVHVRDGHVELRHPLVRSAVYGAATSLERRRAHRALADALDATDADRRAWHLAAAVDEPDETVVAALDAAAERAKARGGHEAASAAFERAAELSVDQQARARRQLGAAWAAWLAAQPGRARALANGAADAVTDPLLRADIVRLQARIEWNTGSVLDGITIVLRGARDVASHDQNRAREMAMFAAALASFNPHAELEVDPTSVAPPPGPDDPPRAHSFHGLLVGLDHVRRQEWKDATVALQGAFANAESVEGDDQDLLPNLGIAAFHVGDDDLAFRYHDMLLTRARSTGALIMVLYALTRRGLVELVTGRWTSLVTGASEAMPLAQGSGQPGLAALPLAEAALVAAFRGQADADDQLAAAEAVAAAHPVGVAAHLLADYARWAKAVRAPQPAAAFHLLEHIHDGPVRRFAALDRIEAAVRADRLDTARAWTDELREYADQTGAPWAAAVAEHGYALLATDPHDAEAHFVQALAHHAGSRRVPARARTELAYGEFLRRARRRVDARVHLRAALEAFEELGAAPLADRAATELRASGETARRRDVSTASDLTAQELNVARLVRQGMSNRDVAGQLFVSPRTVDFHLRNVFSKLGVTSRAELIAMNLPE